MKLRIVWDDSDPETDHPAGWDYPSMLNESRDRVTLLDFEDKEEGDAGVGA